MSVVSSTLKCKRRRAIKTQKSCIRPNKFQLRLGTCNSIVKIYCEKNFLFYSFSLILHFYCLHNFTYVVVMSQKGMLQCKSLNIACVHTNHEAALRLLWSNVMRAVPTTSRCKRCTHMLSCQLHFLTPKIRGFVFLFFFYPITLQSVYT